MQLKTEDFLGLVEESKRLVTWDIEATGLNCDYNSIMCVSIKRFGEKPVTIKADAPGRDRWLCKEVSRILGEARCWVTFYGKGYDVPMLEGRLLKHGLPALERQPHVDVFFQLVGKIKTSRKSQAHLARWLGLPEKKMDMDPDEWNLILHQWKKRLPVMVRRCESDVTTLEQAYKRTKHIYGNVTR